MMVECRRCVTCCRYCRTFTSIRSSKALIRCCSSCMHQFSGGHSRWLLFLTFFSYSPLTACKTFAADTTGSLWFTLTMALNLRWFSAFMSPCVCACVLSIYNKYNGLHNNNNNNNKWKHWVPSMSLRAHFCTTWAGEFPFWAAMTQSICFYFNAFLLLFSVSTPYCCTTVFPLRTTRTSFSTSNPPVLFLIFSHPRFYKGLK